MNFVEELKWRGMLQDIMPGTEDQLNKEMTVAYVGIDPTADSLHIGHLCGIMMLRHFQRCGHKPIALIGGATGMIGDPSGKSAERNLLDEPTLKHNQECIKKQLERFLDFNSNAILLRRLKEEKEAIEFYTLLDFARNVGKLITVNYMMAKDSVKKRFNGEFKEGMSFTEFTYQLLQGYDFVYLNKNYNCKMQMGGSDQWGNITTGTELIRRMGGGDAFALTCPLITKADGTKFGKTESGNIWLDRRYTSPYKFYQFWLNVSDIDAQRYIKIFTNIDKEECENLIEEHNKAPHLRLLQKRLAKDVTIMVHSEDDYNKAVEASNILFGNSTAEQLHQLDEATLLDVFDGVPRVEVDRETIHLGSGIVGFLSDITNIFPSKGEARKLIQSGGIAVNKEKINDINYSISDGNLLNDKYILIQKGKRNYFLVIIK